MNTKSKTWVESETQEPLGHSIPLRSTAMTGGSSSPPLGHGSFAEADYNEIEIGRFDEAEYEAANRRFEAFLEREREERELLEREFAEELEQLLKLIRKNRTDPADPPGWPDL